MARTGTRVTYTWEPDPIVMAENVLEVERGLKNMQMPLRFAAEQTQADIRERFHTETDPDGVKWDDWAKSYEEAAAGNIGILRQSGDLYEDATSDRAVIVTNDSVFYDTSAIPERGIWHQEGRPDRKTKGGSPNPLPQRQFLGLSNEAQVVIWGAFDDWFDRTIGLWETSRGRVGRRHSMTGAGGRFIPRSSPMPTRIGR